jgi:hypothetical protein
VEVAMSFGRALVLAGSLTLGLAASAVAPSCILPDYCIVIVTPGTDWCVLIEEAMMWPVGQPDLAESVSASGGGPPKGCRCFNDADVAILKDGLPTDTFGGLVAEMQADARNECAIAVPPGFDHNCYIEDGSLAPGFGPAFHDGPSDACIGSCSYIKPPPNGACDENPDPYECNAEYGGGETGIDQATDTDGSETGDPSPARVIPDSLEVLR